MDRLKEAEAKRESRQLKPKESEAIRKLKADNRAVIETPIVQSRQPTEQSAQQQQSASPNLIGVIEYRRQYTEQELKKLAASFAVSQCRAEAPTIESFESDPGLAIESQITSAKYKRTVYRYDSQRKRKVIKRARVFCEPPDVEIRWNEKDKLYWAKADVRLERSAVPPGTPNSIFRSIWMKQSYAGGDFVWELWTPPAGWVYKP